MFLVWVWSTIATADAPAASRLARNEDASHAAADLALTIGMTFQISDTDITAKHVRRAALHHALLSYVFGTVIVAITVSSVAGLLGR